MMAVGRTDHERTGGEFLHRRLFRGASGAPFGEMPWTGTVPEAVTGVEVMSVLELWRALEVRLGPQAVPRGSGMEGRPRE